ncbi:MAG: hypothetical protein ACYC7L_14570 [Nitrospirota bacterium]
MPHNSLKRIGISIPSVILSDLQKFVPERKRSEYIVKALQEKIRDDKKRMLREKMTEGYLSNAATDADTAEEWRHLEEEAGVLTGVHESKKTYGRKPGGASKKR